MRLRDNILRVLREAGAEQLSKPQIAQALDMPMGGRDGVEAMRDLDAVLWAMANDGTLAFEYPNARRPEFHFWLPRTAEAAA